MSPTPANVPAHRHVVSLNGVADLGSISPVQAAALGCRSGPIRLLMGFHGKNDTGFGLLHIESRAGRVREIKALGHDVIETIAMVADRFEMADIEANGRLCAVMTKGSAYLHLYLQWDDAGFWSVTTLVPKRHRRDMKAKWTK